MLKSIILITVICLLSACSTTATALPGCPPEMAQGDLCAFDSRSDAKVDLEIAQDIAAENELNTLIVMGANWCHDSRALAGHFESPRLKALIDEHYSLVYIDVGKKNRNIDIAQSFGLEGIVGTPTVIITDSQGVVLNLDTAPTWRNAASRKEDDIYRYFAEFALKGD